VGRSSVAAKWSDAATSTPVEKQWEHDLNASAASHLRDLARHRESAASGDVGLSVIEIERSVCLRPRAAGN
jgi:hypothetical protein